MEIKKKNYLDVIGGVNAFICIVHCLIPLLLNTVLHSTSIHIHVFWDFLFFLVSLVILSLVLRNKKIGIKRKLLFSIGTIFLFYATFFLPSEQGSYFIPLCCIGLLMLHLFNHYYIIFNKGYSNEKL